MIRRILTKGINDRVQCNVCCRPLFRLGIGSQICLGRIRIGEVDQARDARRHYFPGIWKRLEHDWKTCRIPCRSMTFDQRYMSRIRHCTGWLHQLGICLGRSIVSLFVDNLCGVTFAQPIPPHGAHGSYTNHFQSLFLISLAITFSGNHQCSIYTQYFRC